MGLKKCTIYHTGVYTHEEGVIVDNKVYFQGKDNKQYLPKEIFMAAEECEGGLIQFEVDGKWGFADIFTGEIAIEPLWDYAGPFYRGYAHVVLGAELEISGGYHIELKGGKHGYINMKGQIVIPLEYDDAFDIPYRKNFQVAKNGKWGLVSDENQILIPLGWDQLDTNYENNLCFCAIRENCEPYEGPEDRLLEAISNREVEPSCDYILKWGVYNSDFELIIEPLLDEKPYFTKIKTSPRSKNYSFYRNYYVLKKNKKYGLLCSDGRIIENIKLFKKQAKAMVNRISGRSDLYI